MNLNRALILAACLATIPMLAVSAPSARKPAARKVAAKPSAATITNQLIELMVTQNSVVDSCEAAATHIKLITSADEIEHGLSSHGKFKFTDLGFEKDQYETTAQYNERVASQLSVFFGEPGRVAFKAPIPDQSVSYNADLGLLEIQLYSRPSYQSTFTPVTLNLPIFDLEDKAGTKHGQTAMGIKFDYELWTVYKRNISVSFPFEGSNIAEAIDISVPPAEAKKLRQNLMILSFGDLDSPYMTSEDDEDVASLDDPMYVITRTETYYSKPSCLIVFNAASGEVYKTYKVQPSN